MAYSHSQDHHNLTNTQAYFDSLTAYRRGEPAVIVERIAEALRGYRERSPARYRSARDPPRLGEKIKVRRGGTVWRLADVLLLRQPVIDAAVVATELGIEAGNASRRR